MKKIQKYTDGLLTRDEFRERVFKRDGNLCVICKQTAQDAHHILERRLFEDGGYYLSNGASLCGECHIKAEETTLTVEEIRERANIFAPAIPKHFYPDERYDKWGNIILPNGTRTKGELFQDLSVQKILFQGNVLKEFTDYVKYPRTLHLPWSPGATKDDRIHTDLSGFENEEIVITEKMDGENTNFYQDYYHSRSLDSNSHPSQDWARAFHAKIAWNIPKGWRICGENLYAKHSIEYDDLESYFLVFSIWDKNNRCLSWDETVLWCELLELKHVPLIYKGLYDLQSVRYNIYNSFEKRNREGYVIRVARSFQFSEFRKVVGKWVRAGHVQTTHHWKAQRVIPNKIAKNN